MNRCITYIVAIVSGWWLAHSQKHVEESHPKAPATSFNYAEPEVPALDNAKTPYQWYSTGARWGTQLEASEIPTLLESLPATLPRHTSSYLRTILWRHLAEADPIGCWRHWRKQSSRTREQLTPKLLAYWDIPKTMKSSLSTILERQPLRESREITELLRAIEEEDWSTAKTSLGNDGSWIDTVNVAAQLGQRARTAPRAAAEETLSLPHGNNVQQTTLRAVLRTWFEDDPETAWKWISARPMNRYSSDPRDSALSEWAKSDPRAALEKLAELGDSSQWWMRRNMLASWAEHAPGRGARVARIASRADRQSAHSGFTRIGLWARQT